MNSADNAIATHAQPDPDAVTDAIGRWLECFVIAENLCPFAGRAWREGSVRLVVEAGDAEASLARLAQECDSLSATPATLEQTTLIALTHRGFADFDGYLDLVDLGDRLIDALGHRGRVQLASFHPHYRFQGAPLDDPANWSNRSPWPLLHLLDEEDLERAIRRHPDADGIPQRNVERLRALGWSEVRRRASHCSD